MEKIMTEQEATDRHEELCGSIPRAFRLMNIYREAVEAASGNQFTLDKRPSVEERFRSRAKNERYTNEAIEHYLNHVR
jgi:hypothetical protein